MKIKLILTFVILVFGITAMAQKTPEVVKGTSKVEIKTSAVCEMCKETIEYDLAFEKGVKSANLDLSNMVLTVVYKSKKTSADAIRKRITKVGYHADDLTRDPKAYENLPDCCKDGAHANDNKKEDNH